MCGSMNDFYSYIQTCSFYCGCKIRNNEVISLLIRHSVGTMLLCSAKCFCICFFFTGSSFLFINLLCAFSSCADQKDLHLSASLARLMLKK